ncbi:MAG: hypothetical protein JXA33_22585 [Anaerolineae bacterium]|nr:hypothetical protein [Anaerolineae bacterium]
MKPQTVLIAFVRRLATIGVYSTLLLAFIVAVSPARAQEDLPPYPGIQEDRQYPEWWYAPGKLLLPQTQPITQPEWWYAGSTIPQPMDFSTLDISITAPGAQPQNEGVIPVNVHVTADGTTPDIIVQVTSDNVPDQAIYAGYEKTPSGTIQNLGGFQQAKFMGGASPTGVADITFKYEPLTSGWLNFTVQVWVGGNLLRGPETHAVYVSPVTAAFSTYNVSVTPAGSQTLNAGAIPLTVRFTADGNTPPVIIQVFGEDVPGKAIYVDNSRNPDGTIQNLAGFQQAKFMGGVGPDHIAEVTFYYEPLQAGSLNFEVKVWVGDTLIYGPQSHTVYVTAVSSSFRTFSTAASLGGNSQGFNAGYIPLNIQVTANGTTPDIVMQVSSEEIPDHAIYAGYDKSPAGTIQNLGSFQLIRFRGGVGPDYRASVTLNYEPLQEGWINYTVQVFMGGNSIYGPTRHFIYIKPSGAASTRYPPKINTFAVETQVYTQTTFSVDVTGDPVPQYTLDCGSPSAHVDQEACACSYTGPGYYKAELTATNQDDEGVLYTETATAPVLVPSAWCFMPVMMRSYYLDFGQQKITTM